MKHHNSKKEDTGNWLNTYADMVTLLMCFFVMLFAMSSLDKAKWISFVQSINPNLNSQQVVIGQVPPGDENLAENGQTIEDIEALYQELQQFIMQNNLSADIDLFQGPGYIFITFKNNIFFDGNSSAIRQEGMRILDFLAAGLSKIPTEELKEIRVMGHTNQDDPILQNNIDVDRELSSLRAAHVVSYLQKKQAVQDPRILFGTGYGQWYPIAPYDTAENRQLNRRVEILIAKTTAIKVSLDEIYQQIYGTQPAVKEDTLV